MPVPNHTHRSSARPKWFSWYDNHTFLIKNDEGEKPYKTKVHVRILPQPAPIELYPYTHWVNIPKSQMRTELADLIPDIAHTYAVLGSRKVRKLDIVLVNGAQACGSSDNHYGLWVREVFQ